MSRLSSISDVLFLFILFVSLFLEAEKKRGLLQSGMKALGLQDTAASVMRVSRLMMDVKLHKKQHNYRDRVIRPRV